MHDENFLSSWLREDMEGKAEAVEKISKEAFEEEEGRGSLRERGRQGKGVAVVCKRACFEFPSSVNKRVFGMGLEEEVMHLSEDECGHWCGVGVSVLALL